MLQLTRRLLYLPSNAKLLKPQNATSTTSTKTSLVGQWIMLLLKRFTTGVARLPSIGQLLSTTKTSFCNVKPKVPVDTIKSTGTLGFIFYSTFLNRLLLVILAIPLLLPSVAYFFLELLVLQQF